MFLENWLSEDDFSVDDISVDGLSVLPVDGRSVDDFSDNRSIAEEVSGEVGRSLEVLSFAVGNAEVEDTVASVVASVSTAESDVVMTMIPLSLVKS